MQVARSHSGSASVKKMFFPANEVQPEACVLNLCQESRMLQKETTVRADIFSSTNPNLMKQFFLPFFCLLISCLDAQDIEDPSLRKPYRVVVQTGIALQWFDAQFKSFTLSAERPLNLYNHVGIQANFFFPNDDYYYYRTITGDSWELGIFAKCFFHGRLTGRRSNAYIGPDMRLGRRYYLDYGPFDGQLKKYEASTYKFLARLGWQFHWKMAVFELTLPIGFENEKFKNDPATSPFTYNYYENSTWFVVAPALSIGIGF